MKKYVVIGGQYQSYCYGSSDSLRGAKRLASQRREYWDNWQGWHTPKIYSRDDVLLVCGFYGKTYAPKSGARPVAVKYGETESKYSGKWIEGDSL